MSQDISEEEYIDVMKYIWCKHFKLSDFPECCRNCKSKTCDEANSRKR
jgi:hypothetical protein